MEASTTAMFMGVEMAWAQARAAERVRVGMGRVGGEGEGGMVGVGGGVGWGGVGFVDGGVLGGSERGGSCVVVGFCCFQCTWEVPLARSLWEMKSVRLSMYFCCAGDAVTSFGREGPGPVRVASHAPRSLLGSQG